MKQRANALIAIHYSLSGEKGIALMMVLWVLVLLSIISLNYFSSNRWNTAGTRNLKEETLSYYMAMSGYQEAVIEGLVTRPRFIESARLAPFRQRGTDVSVVLDLMIHDIDLIQSIVRSPLTSIDAIGAKVFSDDLDIANVRLRFASGCVANVTASRVSLKTERKLRLFEDEAYLSLDLQQKILTVIRKGAAPAEGDLPQVAIEERTYEQGDALKAEIEAFADSIRTGRPPLVGGAEGLAALETATRIAALVRDAGH